MSKRQRIRTMGNLLQLAMTARTPRSRAVYRAQYEGMKKARIGVGADIEPQAKQYLASL